jgi:hypothetical protein
MHGATLFFLTYLFYQYWIYYMHIQSNFVDVFLNQCCDFPKHFTLLTVYSCCSKVQSWTCKTKNVLIFFSWVQCLLFTVIMCSVMFKMHMSYICSPLTQYLFKFQHSLDHCGHLIMLPNSKTLRDKLRINFWDMFCTVGSFINQLCQWYKCCFIH